MINSCFYDALPYINYRCLEAAHFGLRTADGLIRSVCADNECERIAGLKTWYRAEREFIIFQGGE